MSDPNADAMQTGPGAVPEDAAQGPAADGPDPFAVLEALKAENEALKDKVLRTMAEMENMRRRTDKEVADAKSYGVANFAREMLAVADNLHRAIGSVGAGAREGRRASRRGAPGRPGGSSRGGPWPPLGWSTLGPRRSPAFGQPG